MVRKERHFRTVGKSGEYLGNGWVLCKWVGTGFNFKSTCILQTSRKIVIEKRLVL